jgi:probable phosphoglycerate mutase
LTLPEVWLVRHGETEWTVTKQHTGRTDIELTPEGEEQARAVGALVADHSFAAVFTSPLKRARRTAELAGFGDAVVDERLVELDYGEYEGLTTEEIRRDRPGWLVWRDGSPSGESLEEAGRRADEVLERVTGAGGDVLLFGHGHFSRVLGARLLGLPPEDGRLLMLSPGALSIVSSEHGERAVKSWNRTKI